MLYIKVNATLLYTDQFYTFDDKTYEEIDVDISRIPQEYLYDIDSGKFDVYSLAIWGRGVFCKHCEEQDYYICTETNSSLFSLLDATEERTDLSSELFDYWRAKRQISSYYLEIIVNSVSQELINSYIALIKDWCHKNGKIISEKSFEIPDSSFLFPNGNWRNDKICDIRLMEDTSLFRHAKIYWSTEFPEFEGAGADIVSIIAANPLSAISVLLAAVSLATNGRIRQIFVEREIKACRMQIFALYQNVIKGEIEDPQPNLYRSSKEHKRIYRFTEIKDNKPIAYYLASKKKGRRKRKAPKYIFERIAIMPTIADECY